MSERQSTGENERFARRRSGASRHWARVLSLLWLGLLGLVSPSQAADVLAVAGQPFGVGRITIPMPAEEEDLILQTNGYRLEERQGRIFYPTVVHRRVLGLVRELLGMEDQQPILPSTVTVYFLFTGSEPLDVTFWTPQAQRFTMIPERGPRQFQRLQRAWWQNYHARGRLQEEAGDYPPLLETYLPSMLGYRLGLRAPSFNRPEVDPESTPEESLKLILNVEPMRIQTMERTMAGMLGGTRATQPLPAEINWPQRTIPSPEKAPTIEPMAMHVPEECFYVRFGSFPNYLWLRKFLENNGGSLGRMVTLRGHDAGSNQRIQDQLALKESSLAELFGGQLISDIALIGRDTYLREGAAIGVLFEARNGLLKNELTKQQREAVARWADRGAKLETIRLAEQDVSAATTPDNRLRSFYVQTDRYHLVTNSTQIAIRFLEASAGKRPLGADGAFQSARDRFPVENNATVFAYLSPAFFRGLVSPQYQVELRRRLKAVTDLELVQMAHWVARHERLPHHSIDDLIRARLLPGDFKRRPDGSHVVELETTPDREQPAGDEELPPPPPRPSTPGESASDGGSADAVAAAAAAAPNRSTLDTDRSTPPSIDSLRGARGTFLPIPDVLIDGVTDVEAARCAEMATFHQQQWTEMDPIVAQVERTSVNETGRERIEIQAEVLPFNRQKYGQFLALVGPPTSVKIQQSPDDAITVQCVLQGNGKLIPAGKPSHLFFGIQNREVPIEFARQPVWRLLQILRTAPAYLGSWPELGLLDLIPLGRAPRSDAQGFSQLPFGLWRLQTPAGFSLVGTNPDVLASAADELDVVDDPQSAQVRIHMMDVTTSKIQSWFAALDFQRAYQASIGNTRLLNTMTMQLGIPPSEALERAESLLDVHLVCALGGSYQPRSDAGRRPYWVSTHWPAIRTEQGEEAAFASPSTAWFRGLDAIAIMNDDRIQARVTLEIQQPLAEKPKLPFFDFFR